MLARACDDVEQEVSQAELGNFQLRAGEQIIFCSLLLLSLAGFGSCQSTVMGANSHDGVQPGSYGPLEKQMECLQREKTNNPFLPREQVQNAKK